MSMDALNQDGVNARTTKVMGSLPHERVAAYLKARGWTDAGPYGPFARVYSLGKGASIKELVVPNTNSVADYLWRMRDIVQTLALLEKRPVTSVCSDLMLQDDGVAGQHDKPQMPHAAHPGEAAERQRDAMLAIQSRMDSLINDATRHDLDDLARFLALASLAAKEAAKDIDPKEAILKALMDSEAGQC